MATNAFLKWALGSSYSATLDGIMEMPKPGSKLTLDFSSLLGPLFFTWLLELLLPVMVVQLVTEKERKSAPSTLPRLPEPLAFELLCPTSCHGSSDLTACIDFLTFY